MTSVLVLEHAQSELEMRYSEWELSRNVPEILKDVRRVAGYYCFGDRSVINSAVSAARTSLSKLAHSKPHLRDRETLFDIARHAALDWLCMEYRWRVRF